MLSQAKESSSTPASNDFPKNVYWGDTHVHTRISADAWSGGDRIGLEEAYRFAQGEEVTSSSGQKAKLRLPLDFLVIADHATNAGVYGARFMAEKDKAWLKTADGKLWSAAIEKMRKRAPVFAGYIDRGWISPTVRPGGAAIRHKAFRHSIWQRNTEAADRYNDPGNFTAFIGYEWSPNGAVAKGAIHRNVIFRDAADKADQIIPFSSYDSAAPEDLWNFMAEYEKETGGRVLAIPHNSNLTNGVMFALTDSKGNALSEEYAKLRSRWEPLLEATQIKGDSEAHPYESPDDEFADYETWNGWGGREDGLFLGRKLGIRENWKIKHEYARSALKLGLSQKAKLGANPFKFGMVGGSDSHTSLAGIDEDNFWGKSTVAEPSAKRIFASDAVSNWEMVASGYAAVWAKENTRQSLFAAMQRKETYATTGPRIVLRFFGGWDYKDQDADGADFVRVGYAGGVPMGGDLSNGPKGSSPSFLVRAVMDPNGANLDRVQVIKGWRDSKGELQEKVYNVAVSDGRKIARNGSTKPVGSTVNIKKASYKNSIGDPELSVVWRDPDFDANELSFYYVRVIEIPTPRWTAYDVKNYRLKNVPEKVEMVTQERAYSSPIWYTPASRE